MSEGLFGQSFSVAPPIHIFKGLPCLWPFSVVQCMRHIEGSPWLGSNSVDWCVRHLKGHPRWVPTLWLDVSGTWWASLSIVQLKMLACEERKSMVRAPPSMHDSAISPCFHGCLAFFHKHFLPQSLTSCPLSPCLCSQQKPLPWDYSTVHTLQLPVAIPSMGPVSLSKVCMAVSDFHSI